MNDAPNRTTAPVIAAVLFGVLRKAGSRGKAEFLHYYCCMARMAQHTASKKKLRSKGERLNWVSLKDAKPIVLSKETLQSCKLQKSSNDPSDSNLLVP